MVQATINATQQATSSLNELNSTLLTTGQQLMNARATFLFSAFAMMAMARVADNLTSKFRDASQAMQKHFADIEYQAVTTSTVLVGTSDKYEQVMDRMIELGRETEYTAVQAGEGMEVLARAGLDVGETITAIEPVLDMARANNMEVGETARFTAGMFHGWNLSTRELNDELRNLNVESSQADRNLQNISMVSAIVTHAARKSRQEMDELAQAMRYATAAAQTVGWEMEEVAVGMMVSANSMIDAGMAGRSFRRVMTRVGMVAGETGRGIQQSRDLMDRYGIQLKDSQGEMIGLIDLVEELEKATKDLTGTQRVNLYQQLAGMRGMNSLSAAVEEGSEKMREQELALKASAAAAALSAEHGGDAKQEIIDMKRAIDNSNISLEDNVSFMEDIRDKFDLSAEATMRLNDVLTDTTLSMNEFEDMMEDVTVVSEMVDARLDTLKGTNILLESSLEALWASLAKGKFAEIMQSWVVLLRRLSDAISQLPGPLKTFIALTILFGSVLNRIVPNALMFVAMMTIMRAATVSMRLEEHQMMLARSEAMSKIPAYKAAMQEVINQKINEANMTRVVALLTENEKASLDNLTIAKVRNKAITKLQNREIATQIALLHGVGIENAEVLHTEAQKVLVDELATDVNNKKNVSLATEGNLKSMVAKQTAALTAATWRYVGASFAAFGGISLFIYGMSRGNKIMRIAGILLTFLGASLMLVKYAFNSTDTSIKLYIANMLKAHAANIKFLASLTFGLAIILILIEYADPLLALIGSIVVGVISIGIALNFAENAGKKIIIILYIVAIVLYMVINYFVDLDEILVGNSVVPSLWLLSDVLGAVGKAIEFIMKLFEAWLKVLKTVEGKLKDFGSFIVDLIGNSLIPDSFESGIGRIVNDFEKLIGEVHKTENELDKFAKYSDNLMGHSIIPEAFENGAERIMNSMQKVKDIGFEMSDTPSMVASGTATPTQNNASINVDMRGFTAKSDMSPKELQDIVKEGISEALRRWDKKAQRY